MARSFLLLILFLIVLRATEKADFVVEGVSEAASNWASFCSVSLSTCLWGQLDPARRPPRSPALEEAATMVSEAAVNDFALDAKPFVDPFDEMSLTVEEYPRRRDEKSPNKFVRASEPERAGCATLAAGTYVRLLRCL